MSKQLDRLATRVTQTHDERVELAELRGQTCDLRAELERKDHHLMVCMADIRALKLDNHALGERLNVARMQTATAEVEAETARAECFAARAETRQAEEHSLTADVNRQYAEIQAATLSEQLHLTEEENAHLMTENAALQRRIAVLSGDVMALHSGNAAVAAAQRDAWQRSNAKYVSLQARLGDERERPSVGSGLVNIERFYVWLGRCSDGRRGRDEQRLARAPW